jgi:hypothetical protein
MISDRYDVVVVDLAIFAVFLDVLEEALFIGYLEVMLEMVMNKKLSDDDFAEFPLPCLKFGLLYVRH